MLQGPVGRSFGHAALDYERGRPEWPDEALDLVPLPADAEVLDLAAGTGKLTQLLAARYRQVIAVEPDDDMRALIGGVETLPGTAEQIPLPDASADAVFVADAFHWFDVPAALREIARVLRPSGTLVLLWNLWSREDFEPSIPKRVLERLEAVYVRMGRPGGPRYETRAWREAFVNSAFEPLREEVLRREVVADADAVASLWLSVSSVAALPEEERDRLARDLRAELSGTYRLNLRTDLYWTRLVR